VGVGWGVEFTRADVLVGVVGPAVIDPVALREGAVQQNVVRDRLRAELATSRARLVQYVEGMDDLDGAEEIGSLGA
jgi:hypothetical protein